jgi:tetratricopeptide (TPR) repeat protein
MGFSGAAGEEQGKPTYPIVFIMIRLLTRIPASTPETGGQRRLPARGVPRFFPNTRRQAGWLPAGLCASALMMGGLVCATAQNPAGGSIQQAMLQGSKAMTSGDFAAAVTAYSTVTHQQPDLAEGHFNLGLALFQSGQLDNARPELARALALKPGLRGANLFLGLIDYRENRFKEAEASLERETTLDSRNAKAFMWLGVCRLAEENPPGAIAALDKAYALDPHDVDILYHRGRAYYLVANASYAAMFQLNPDSVRVHQVLAEAYAQATRNQQAIAELEMAVKIAPHQPGLHEELADQYWVVGDLDKATVAYHEELTIDPHATSSKYKLGSLLVLSQNPAEGVSLLRDALHADPSLEDAHYYLGVGLAATDQPTEAVGEFNRAISADPKNDRAISAYFRLAQVYRKLHQNDEAQAAMQNFLRLRAESRAVHDDRAAQIARKRTELPVENPDRAAIEGGAG